MKIMAHSNADSNGWEYVLVSLVEPEIDENDLYSGGKILSFDMDNKKQQTTCTKMWFQHGGWRMDDKPLKTWKDEILSERECLQFAETVQF